MPYRPQRLPRWAYAAPSGALIEPPSSEQEDGFVTGTKPPAQYVNWMLHYGGAWVDFLRSASLMQWATNGIPYLTSALTFASLSIDDATAESTTLVTRNVIAAMDGSSVNCVFTASRIGDQTVWTRRTNFTATGTFYRSAFLGGRHWICVDHASAGVLLTVAGGSAVLSGTGSWTAATLPGATPGIRGIAYDSASGYWAAVSRDGILATASATSWTAATLGTALGVGALFTDIVWSGTAFLAVTSLGEVYKASGGAAALGSWTALTALAPGAGAWRLSAGASGAVVAWRENTGSTLDFYTTSNDGTSWTAVTSSPSVERVRSLRLADNTWVAATTEAPYLWQSNDLTNWTRLKLPYNGSTAVFDCAYSEGSWIAVRDAEALVGARAEDLAPGVWAADPTPTALSDAAFLRGRTISTTAPTDGQVYVWVAATSAWTPQDPGPWSAWSTATASTTDATQTTCGTYTVPTSYGVVMEAMIVATMRDRSASVGWTLLASAANAAGTVTLHGTPVVTGPTDAATTWDVTASVSGTSLRVRVTGAAATTIDWRVTWRVVGSTG